MKATQVKYTRIDFNDKASVMVPSEDMKGKEGIVPNPDATITFHTTGGDQSIKVKIIGYKQAGEKKFRLTVTPA